MNKLFDRIFWRTFFLRILIGLGLIAILLVLLSAYLSWIPKKEEPKIAMPIIDEHGNTVWSNPPSTALEKVEATAQAVKKVIAPNLPKPQLGLVEVLRTNKTLKEMSATNAAFQQWGTSFMLNKANDFLSKVPFYGLDGPLNSSQVVCTSCLTHAGAQLWLVTTNRSHEMQYEFGVLGQINALQADMAGIGHYPEKLESFGNDPAPWSKEEAERRAYEVLG